MHKIRSGISSSASQVHPALREARQGGGAHRRPQLPLHPRGLRVHLPVALLGPRAGLRLRPLRRHTARGQRPRRGEGREEGEQGIGRERREQEGQLRRVRRGRLVVCADRRAILNFDVSPAFVSPKLRQNALIGKISEQFASFLFFRRPGSRRRHRFPSGAPTAQPTSGLAQRSIVGRDRPGVVPAAALPGEREVQIQIVFHVVHFFREFVCCRV